MTNYTLVVLRLISKENWQQSQSSKSVEKSFLILAKLLFRIVMSCWTYHTIPPDTTETIKIIISDARF